MASIINASGALHYNALNGTEFPFSFAQILQLFAQLAYHCEVTKMVPWSLTVRVIGLPNTMIPYQTNLNVLNVRTQLKQLTFLGLTVHVFMKE